MNKIVYDVSFLCFLLLTFALQQPQTIVASYVCAALYIIVSQRNIIIKSSNLLAWGGATVICMLPIISFNHGITPLFYLVVTPLLIISAKHFTNQSLEHITFCLRSFYWLFVLIIAIGLAVYWGEAEPLGSIIPGTSTNGLPSYLIVVQIAYSLACYLKTNRLPIFSSITTLMIAFIGLGRASIIVATLILFFSIFANTITSKSDRKVLFRLVAVTILPLVMYFYESHNYIISVVEQLIAGSKFSASVMDDGRKVQIDDYINKLDTWTFLFGADYSNTSIEQYFGGRPENSYLRLHAYFGISGFFIVFTSLLLIAVSNRLKTQKIIALTLISMSLLRATTEAILFPTVLDFFYFLYLFIYFQFSKKM
jgi:hypothetical protein